MLFLYSLFLFILIAFHTYFIYINYDKAKLRLTQIVFLCAEYSIISYFFYLITKSIVVKNIILIAIIPFVSYVIFDFTISDKTNINFYLLVIECLSFLTYISYFFYEKFKSDIITPIYQTSIFWFVCSFFLYSSGNFFLFLFRENIPNNSVGQLEYVIIYSTFTILKNILLCIGFAIKDMSAGEKKSEFSSIEDPWEIPAEYKKTNP